MADILDRLNRERELRDNASIAQTEHDLNWARQFASTPPENVLRANRDYLATANRAMQNKLDMLAQTDEKAARLREIQQRMQMREKSEPLKRELLQSKIEAEGSHDRFLAQKDRDAAADASRFFSALDTIKAKPGTPEYRAGLTAAVAANPRVAGTQIGNQVLKALFQEHDDAAALTPPPGMEIDRIDYSDGRLKGVFKPIQPPSTTAVPEGMVPTGATTNKRGDVSVSYGPPKKEDGIKQASAVRGQIRTLEAQARDHRKTIAEIEKDAPGWIGTTGIFTDKKGVRRYGKKDVEAELSPMVTEESEEKFKRYQDAVRKRDEIEERVPQLNQQLDDLLNGAPAAKESPATEDGVPAGQPSSHEPTPDAPQVGHERGGYRFKGGNPADKSNWEKI